MEKQVVREGNVYSVSLDAEHAALCRIVFTSSYFNRVMLITVHGLITVERNPLEQVAEQEFGSFYCSTDCVVLGEWKLLGATSISSHDREKSRRIVGGDVWQGDEHLGPYTQSDAGLPQMDVYGERILNKRLARVVLA